MWSWKLCLLHLDANQFQTVVHKSRAVTQDKKKSRTVTQSKNCISIFKGWHLNKSRTFRIKYIIFRESDVHSVLGKGLAFSGDEPLQNFLKVGTCSHGTTSHTLTCYEAYSGAVAAAEFRVPPCYHGNAKVVVPGWQQICYPLKKARRKRPRRKIIFLE